MAGHGTLNPRMKVRFLPPQPILSMKLLLKIFLLHLAVFLLGSAAIGIYAYSRFPEFVENTGLGGVIVGPVILSLYIIIFGILCLISLAVALAFSFIRRRLRRAKGR